MSIRPLYNRIARARRLAAASTPSAAPATIAVEEGAAPSSAPQLDPLATAEDPAPSKPKKPKNKASKASNTSQPSPTINP